MKYLVIFLLLNNLAYYIFICKIIRKIKLCEKIFHLKNLVIILTFNKEIFLNKKFAAYVIILFFKLYKLLFKIFFVIYTHNRVILSTEVKYPILCNYKSYIPFVSIQRILVRIKA